MLVDPGRSLGCMKGEAPSVAAKPPVRSARLRRDLGRVEAYAALIGILVGAGIFRVTSDASALTGPSVILAHVVLTAAILATAVPYMVFLSTPLGAEPGGEYGHIRATFQSPRFAFLCGWLKLITYLGAGTYLAVALADYALVFVDLVLGTTLDAERWRTPVALGGLVLFWSIHVVGVRWFGRVQVAMCALLGVAIVVLVVPGLFVIEPSYYRPFFKGGLGGFAGALPPLFFAYAGFESLAHTGGEVVDSRRELPRTFLRGIGLTAVIFIAMSVVAFGVLPVAALEASDAPMADVARAYLPVGGTALVAFGGVLAVATSLNATLYVPARLAIQLAEDGGLPRWAAAVHPRTGVPAVGLTASLVAMSALLVSNQLGLALGIAIFSLMVLYLVHGLALLALPRLAPALYGEVLVGIPRPVQVGAALVSIGSLAVLLGIQVHTGLGTIARTTFADRLAQHELTSIELFVAWTVAGAIVYEVCRLVRRYARR